MSSAARPFVAVLLCGLLAAACGSQAVPSTNASPTDAASASSAPGEETPGPEESASPGETEPPVESPSAPSSAAPGSDGCSGSLDNRTFFEQVAGQVSWDVYCAVLPQGWFVADGKFTLRDGGHIEITYKGPNGAHFSLQEGNVCSGGASACAPHDRDLGPASIGEHQGELFSLGADGRFAVYVAANGFPAWNAIGTSLDQATFSGFVAALHLVKP